MKIESFKINVAVADGVKRGLLAQKAREALSGICFGVEIEDATPPAPPSAEPRKKRKYTRRAKPASEDGSEQRIRNEDATTIIRRGRIPAGGDAS